MEDTLIIFSSVDGQTEKIANFIKNKKVILIIIVVFFAVFVALWNVVSGGYDKQNKTIIFLKNPYFTW